MTGNSSRVHEPRRVIASALTVGILVAANVVTVAAVIVAARRQAMTSATAISILALFVYFETFVAIVWYTIETRRTQRAVAGQTEELATQTRLSILPAFVMEFGIKPFNPSEITSDLNEYYLYNLGRGIALNISVERRKYVEESYPEATIAFERTLVIQPGEKRKVPYKETLGKPSATHPPVDLVTRLKDRPRLFREYEYHVGFDDLLGNRYSQVLYITSRGCLPGRITLLSSARAA